MSDINKVILNGRVASDPQFHTLEDEKHSTVCNVKVATNRRWKAPDGTIRELPQFSTCQVWGPAAVSAQKMLTRGARVFIEGHLETRSDDRDGVRRTFTHVVVEHFTALDPRPKEDTTTEVPRVEPQDPPVTAPLADIDPSEPLT